MRCNLPECQTVLALLGISGDHPHDQTHAFSALFSHWLAAWYRQHLMSASQLMCLSSHTKKDSTDSKDAYLDLIELSLRKPLSSSPVYLGVPGAEPPQSRLLIIAIQINRGKYLPTHNLWKMKRIACRLLRWRALHLQQIINSWAAMMTFQSRTRGIDYDSG